MDWLLGHAWTLYDDTGWLWPHVFTVGCIVLFLQGLIQRFEPSAASNLLGFDLGSIFGRK